MERTDDAIYKAICVLPKPPNSFLPVPAAASALAPAPPREGGGAVNVGGDARGGRRRRGDGGRGLAAGDIAGGTTRGGRLAGGAAEDEPEGSEGTVACGPVAGVGSLRQGVEEGALIRVSNRKCNLERYDPSVDLYKFGRPAPEFWYNEWMDSPLVLHDKGFLLARDSLGIQRCEGLPNLTDEINDVLDNHPGPVSCFRIDSSTWNDGDQLVRWCQTLSRKRTKEITLMNLGWPVGTVFPMDELLSPSLTILRLGFMKILDDDLLSFGYSSLSVLQLICCSYRGAVLSYIVSACNSLTELNIGYSMEDVTINSQSLQELHIWSSSGGFLTVECAPKLKLLTTGLRPKKGKSSIPITINGAPSLREVDYLILSYHRITLNNTMITKEVQYISSISLLRIGIKFADRTHRSGLRNILECFSGFQSL